MYEFVSILAQKENKLNIKNLSFSKLYSYPGDYELAFERRNFVHKSFARIPPKDYYININEEHFLLFGEAYTSRNYIRERNSVFCTIKDILELKKIYPNYLDILKGNFFIIQYNEKLLDCKIISSKLSLNSLYYTIYNESLIISTNLAQILDIIEGSYQYNFTTIIEQQLFYFPFYDSTIIKNVQRVLPSSIIEISNSKIVEKKYFDYKQFYYFSKKDNAKELFIQKLFEVTNDLVPQNEKVNIALTGGFDSRTLFAMLKSRKDIHYQTYAFGLDTAVNTNIPLNISKKLGFKFTPIYLDDSFDNNFNYWFELCSILSDGYYGERANYPFAYSKLRRFANVSLNGNWGSEALRPFQNFTSLITKEFYQILNSKDPLNTFSQLFDEYKNNSFIRNDYLIGIKEEIAERLKSWLDSVKDFSAPKKAHMYMYFENEPKYFANEIQTERLFATNRYPYYDNEILEILFSSTFSGLTKEVFTKSFYTIFDSQRVYFEILKKYAPELLPFKTDHGFSPNVFGSKIGAIRLLLGLIKKRTLSYFSLLKDFKNHELAQKYYQSELNNHLQKSEFSEYLSPFYHNFNSYNGFLNQFRYDNINSLLVWDALSKKQRFILREF